LRLWGDGDSPGESSQTQRADVWHERSDANCATLKQRASQSNWWFHRWNTRHSACQVSTCSNWKHQKISENITNHGCKSALSAWDSDFLRTKNTGNLWKQQQNQKEHREAPRERSQLVRHCPNLAELPLVI
jgi:hypothetical protein